MPKPKPKPKSRPKPRVANAIPEPRNLESYEDLLSVEGRNKADGRFLSTACVGRKAHHVFYGEVLTPLEQLEVEDVIGCLRAVPDAVVYPKAPSARLRLPIYRRLRSQGKGEVHVKRPLGPKLANDCRNWVEGREAWKANPYSASSKFLEEARVLDLVRRKPHPNLVEFKGCVVEDGLLVGLAQRKYLLSTELSAFMPQKEKAKRTMNSQQYIDGVRAAAEHLHTLGYAHNDINPNNIMFHKDGRPVLVDLGSCQKFGEELREFGTQDWNEGFRKVSDVENDEVGLRMLRRSVGL